MGESSKFPKSSAFEIQILKLAVCLFKFKWLIVFILTVNVSKKLSYSA